MDKKPVQKKTINDTYLRDLAKQYLDGVSSEGYDMVDDDLEHYMLEAVMMMYYGDDVFEYLNTKSTEAEQRTTG